MNVTYLKRLIPGFKLTFRTRSTFTSEASEAHLGFYGVALSLNLMIYILDLCLSASFSFCVMVVPVRFFFSNKEEQ